MKQLKQRNLLNLDIAGTKQIKKMKSCKTAKFLRPAPLTRTYSKKWITILRCCHLTRICTMQYLCTFNSGGLCVQPM